MSLVRPQLPENRPLNTEASFRTRGLRGFDPAQLPAVQDPFYAQDPIFWQFGAVIGAAAGNTAKLGIQTPADPTLRCIVDGCLISSGTATAFLVNVTVGGAVLAVLVTDPGVLVKNRTAQEQSGAPSASGLLRIQDNGVFAGGANQLGQLEAQASKDVFFPLGYTLFASEQLFVATSVVNISARGVFWGRLSRGGR